MGAPARRVVVSRSAVDRLLVVVAVFACGVAAGSVGTYAATPACPACPEPPPLARDVQAILEMPAGAQYAMRDPSLLWKKVNKNGLLYFPLPATLDEVRALHRMFPSAAETPAQPPPTTTTLPPSKETRR